MSPATAPRQRRSEPAAQVCKSGAPKSGQDRSPSPFSTLLLSRAVLICLACATAILCSLVFIQPVAGPRLRLPELPLYLGEGKPSELMTGSFKLQNVGDRPLKFQIAASCGCSTLEPREGVIAPGHTQHVEIGVRLAAEPGTHRRVRLDIRTNDPDASSVAYHVSADCPAALLASPRTIDFGYVAEGTGAAVRLRVHDGEGQPLRNREDLNIRTDSPHVRVAWDDGEEDSALHVTLTADAPRTVLNSRIELQLPGEAPIVVPVRAVVSGPILVAPARLRLRRPDESGHGGLSRLLVWTLDGQLLGAVTRIESPPSVLVQESGGPSTKRRLFEVRATDQPQSSDESEVRLFFEELEEPVTVAVRIATAKAP